MNRLTKKPNQETSKRVEVRPEVIDSASHYENTAVRLNFKKAPEIGEVHFG